MVPERGNTFSFSGYHLLSEFALRAQLNLPKEEGGSDNQKGDPRCNANEDRHHRRNPSEDAASTNCVANWFFQSKAFVHAVVRWFEKSRDREKGRIMANQSRWCPVCIDWFDPEETQLCAQCKREPVAVCPSCKKPQRHTRCVTKLTPTPTPTIIMTPWECPNCHQKSPDVGAEPCDDCGTIIPICILCGKPHPHETCATDENLVFVR